MKTKVIFIILFIIFLILYTFLSTNIFSEEEKELMKLTIKNQDAMYIVGVMSSGESVKDIDIHRLWELFKQYSDSLAYTIPDRGYEIHMDIEDGKKIHYCICGAQVKKVEDIPVEMFVKEIPAGKYAFFTHQFSYGGYNVAFENVRTCLNNSEYEYAYPFDVQIYDSRFKGPGDPNSIFTIMIPVKEKQSE